jgi:hypothetical protein
MNDNLPRGIIDIHNAFARDGIPHAFGGAIALAYWAEPRATADIDINVFLSQDQRVRVLDSIATVIPLTNRADAERQIEHTAQVRLGWDRIPVDLFFSNSEFHDAMAERARIVDYVGTKIPVLSAEDLIICKAAFNRPKDWLDIEREFQIQRSALDAAYLRRWLREFYPAPEDEPRLRVEGFISQYLPT